MEVEDRLELSSDVMKYVVIEERLMKLLRKWKDAKRTNLEYYIAYKIRRPIDRIQPYLITNMSINSRRAQTHLCFTMCLTLIPQYCLNNCLIPINVL